MNQKKLHKLVETIASGKFPSEKEMLINTIQGIVKSEDIDVTGGRIWKLNESEKAYTILYQSGKIEKIKSGFTLKIDEYPLFDLIAKERTILGDETNAALREKGIFKYSASGVGGKKKTNEKYFYEYISLS